MFGFLKKILGSGCWPPPETTGGRQQEGMTPPAAGDLSSPDPRKSKDVGKRKYSEGEERDANG